MDSKNDTKGTILIAVLIIIAVALGLAIYKQYNPSFNLSLGGKSSKTDVSPTPKKSSSSSKRIIKERRPIPEGLSTDEKALLNPPNPGASDSEKSKHFALVTKMAEEADILDINKCEKPSPLVIKLARNSDFKVANNDTKGHTLWVDDNHSYAIPAGSTKTFKADFGRGPGSYGYLCDDLGGVVGFFLVSP